ncbi:NAD(P)-dependent oxidoreductase [Nocardioides mangrovicus]|uniref:NAD(P)-dependent oxidoreductase n=1 Tax=Nocardioides mangrovicus TaxID=2478913 RepID=A0A3L8P417_9ACTN|nr:NAD(P)-dependent oxidoreductase [Nocardioides mangrovicus]RLV49178.1 NAD(P)-dependent oxidoreductase [Nocardioides mangrovicus]
MSEIALVTAGEMGAAVGAQLVGAGHRVRWLPAGRSEASRARADAAGLEAVERLPDSTEVLLSICPPAAARQVASQFASLDVVYVDANAVAPATVRSLRVAHLVDGGIVGGPPTADSGPRLYLSGERADAVAALFEATTVQTRVLGPDVGTASAMKACYAAWTKGSAALLLDVARLADALEVAEPLRAEWEQSLPGLPERLAAAERSATTKGWRWVAEMQEIAETFASSGLPDGFHRAAAEVFGQP